MKKLLSLILVSIAFFQCADDKPISISGLPAGGQKFISDHFADSEVLYVTMDNDFFCKSYDVLFTDGGKIEFDGNGVFKDIDLRFVPMGALPGVVRDHIAAKHAGVEVKSIERDRKYYDVELANGLEFRLDHRGGLIKYD